MKPALFECLKNYKKEYLPKDLMAGLMVAVIAMPLSIALGLQSVPEAVSTQGLQYGIVTAIIAGFLISALGGSRFQIGGPTAAFVVILFGYLANPEIGIVGLAAAGILAGILLVIMGVCRVGSLMKFFPYPVTIGFTTGIGITLMIGQIKDLCGLNSTGSGAVEKLISYVQNIGSLNVGTLVVGLVGLATVIILPKINKKLPSSFIALILCTGVCLLINNCFGGSVATIGSKYGEVKAGFNIPDFSQIINLNFGKLALPAVVIAFLCAIESLLSATVAGEMTGTAYDANQELVGQGVANIASSCLGGLPATGAIARTAAGIENGAKSPLSGIFHAIFLLVMYCSLMGVMGYVPLAAFSAILISVAINMSRFPLFAKLLKFGRADVLTVLVTCVLTVFFDLTYGVIGGVALCLICNIAGFKKGITIESNNGVICASGSAFFANTGKIANAVTEAAKSVDKVELNLAKLDRIDMTALSKLMKLKKELGAIGKTLEFSGATDSTKSRLDRYENVL